MRGRYNDAKKLENIAAYEKLELKIFSLGSEICQDMKLMFHIDKSFLFKCLQIGMAQKIIPFFENQVSLKGPFT